MKGDDIIFIFKEEIDVTFTNYVTDNYNSKKYVILDIETTGLSPKYTQVILVGFIINIDNKWYLIQILCDNRNEEKNLLTELIKYFTDENMLITYNGHSFDLPYLNKRLEHHNIPFQFDSFMNFDLYRVVRSGKKSLGLDSYKLKSIERYLEIERDDTISGKESVELYNMFEENQSKLLKDKILLHNYEDIKFLIPTLRILEHIPNEIIDKFYPFIVNTKKYNKIRIESFEISKSYISISFSTSAVLNDVDDYSESYTYTLNSSEEKTIIKISLPIFTISTEVDYKFIDIDAIDFINISFNELDYENQLKYLITNKKDTVLKIVSVFEEYYSN